MPANITIRPSGARASSPTLAHPTLALVLYEGDGPFVLKHPVQENGKGQPVLGTASGLTAQDSRVLFQALGAQGLTPTLPNTLATSPVACAWWTPAGVRPLLFDAKYGATRSIARLTGVPVPHPPLVFIATPGRLQIYALRESERPFLDTPLTHAPFWNLFKGGVVCQGSVQYPSRCTPDTQEAWETVFFQSVFTGPSRTDRYMDWGRSYEELLDEAVRRGTFPQEVLMEAGTTLAEALR